MDYNFIPKEWDVHRMRETKSKNEKQNRTIHKKNNIHYPIYRNSQGLVLDKVNVAEIHIYVSFSFRRGFLSFI